MIYLVNGLAVAVITYLLGSFAAMSLNPALWPDVLRYVAALLFAPFTCAFVAYDIIDSYPCPKCQYNRAIQFVKDHFRGKKG